MNVNTLNLLNLQIEKKTLDIPSLEDLSAALLPKLCENYDEVCVEVVDCPDLTQSPFNLAAKGLSGNETILDIGGPAFLLPLVKKDKIYDLRPLPKLVNDKECFVIGAGAGPWPYAETNCEIVWNSIVTEEKILKASSRLVKLSNGVPQVEIIPDKIPYCCLMANVFSSRGEPGKVIKVYCKNRIGKSEFIATLREALANKFPDKIIGMGGVFVVLQGKVKQHIMQDFSKEPLISDEDLNNWLRFFDMSGPLTAVGTFVSKDPGLDLRMQHFHSFGEVEGGHYHHDVTPNEIEYLAYFSCGKILYRVDRPEVATKFGAD